LQPCQQGDIDGKSNRQEQASADTRGSGGFGVPHEPVRGRVGKSRNGKADHGRTLSRHPWRSALLDNVKAECLTGLRRFPEADALIAQSMPALMKKWSPGSLYGADALGRAVRLYQSMGDAARAAKYRRMAAM
jgi:hypothetical protein